jgi:hypothetical protein
VEHTKRACAWIFLAGIRDWKSESGDVPLEKRIGRERQEDANLGAM